MTRPGETRPRPVRAIAAPRVADQETARAIGDLDAAIREEQQDPKLPRSGFAGEMFYRAADGTFVSLGIGTVGQVLTVSADGLPAWEDP